MIEPRPLPEDQPVDRVDWSGEVDDPRGSEDLTPAPARVDRREKDVFMLRMVESFLINHDMSHTVHVQLKALATAPDVCLGPTYLQIPFLFLAMIRAWKLHPVRFWPVMLDDVHGSEDYRAFIIAEMLFLSITSDHAPVVVMVDITNNFGTSRHAISVVYRHQHHEVWTRTIIDTSTASQEERYSNSLAALQRVLRMVGHNLNTRKLTYTFDRFTEIPDDCVTSIQRGPTCSFVNFLITCFVVLFLDPNLSAERNCARISAYLDRAQGSEVEGGLLSDIVRRFARVCYAKVTQDDTSALVYGNRLKQPLDAESREVLLTAIREIRTLHFLG